MPRIELKLTHTHAGTVYPAGHVIEADEHTARWLIEHGVARAAIATPNPVLDGMVDFPAAPAPKPNKPNRKE